MPSIDICIGAQKFAVKGEGEGAHLCRVAELVQSRLDALLEAHPKLTATKVALLAAMEFASQTIENDLQLESYRSTIKAKAEDILQRIERELAPG